MQFTPSYCPKCGGKRPASRGRPSRWCSEGCKRSGEAEMTRLQALLRKFEEGRAIDALNGFTNAKRVQVLTDLQARYDHLAGVPPIAAEAPPGALVRS
jgi:hypothetical protein